MIRGIDTQLMLQRSVDVGKLVADKSQLDEEGKAFVAQLEKEQAEKNASRVMKSEQAEHRRVEKDKEDQQQRQNYEGVIFESEEDRELEETAARETAPDIKVDGVGFGLDISV